MLLIVATESDPHADAVITALREESFESFRRIDLETFETRDTLRYRCAGTRDLVQGLSEWVLGARDLSHPPVSSTEVKTVWWRRSTTRIEPRGIPQESDLDSQEAYNAIQWAVRGLPARLFPLGHPDDHKRASNKLVQLQAAIGAGFHVPRTIWSNDAAEIRAFVEESPTRDYVVKPLHAFAAQQGGAELSFYSRKLSGRELLGTLEGVERTALLVQDAIEKRADVRVTVLQGRTLACEIDNSRLKPGEVDWRSTTLDHDHRIVDVPIDIQRRIESYLREMRIPAGAFDFALTPEGEWVFFECNPNGQWLWIEMKTRAPLARSIARLLREHHDGALPDPGSLSIAASCP